MNIAFIHYNIGSRDDINTVMRTNALDILATNTKATITFIGSYERDLVDKQFLRKSTTISEFLL